MTRKMLLEMINAERERSKEGFLEGVDLDEYVDKLLTHSEILIRSQGKRCLGVLAFYCNSVLTGRAFISLLLVVPDARRRGIAHDLLDHAIRIARSRGFNSIGIEVSPANLSAQRCYGRFGFKVNGERNGLICQELDIKHDKGRGAFSASLSSRDEVLRVAQ